MENVNQPIEKLPTGAVASTRHKIEAATPHVFEGVMAATFLYHPPQISYWGNNDHKNSVVAEEAFAKACFYPYPLISDEEVINWARWHGWLEGARISDVLEAMTINGFNYNGVNYGDGIHYKVDWTNQTYLRNAILNGPVKLGVGSEQLHWAYASEYVLIGRRNGWCAANFQEWEPAVDHCISLCGYGTLESLTKEFNTPVPTYANPEAPAYAFFTWNSIGIIDHDSMVKITHEAWYRVPTTQTLQTPPINTTRFAFEALGGERGHYLSHANNSVWLQNGIQGEGEVFEIQNLPNNRVALACTGAEKGKFLSHAYGGLSLQPWIGGGELWICQDRGNNTVVFQALGAETGKFLSHAFNRMWLQNGYQGEGELWAMVGK